MARHYTDVELRKMAAAIEAWLNYILAIKHKKYTILAESSIRYPLTEFLEHSDGVRDINLEIAHPTFERKRIDFRWICEGSDIVNKNKRKYTEVYNLELKYVREATAHKEEQTRVILDLLRLYYTIGKNTYGFFVMCGESINFNLYFNNSQIVANNQNNMSVLGDAKQRAKSQRTNNLNYDDVFSFDIGAPEKTISFGKVFNPNDKKEERLAAVYGEFTKYIFKNNGSSHPNALDFKTRLVYITPTEPNQDGIKSMIGIWEIIQ